MMNLSVYKNPDGTYTSPKNGKIYKSEKALRSHLFFKRTELFHNFKNINDQSKNCKFCTKSIGLNNLSNHENNCYLNPTNQKLCTVCSKPILNFRISKGTCSKSCANTYFRSGEENGNWRQDRYRTTCFLYHKKECVVCGENKIVTVHHLDEDNKNNDPSNLIPLCPTHHQYWHSRYRHLVQDVVYCYIKEWKEKLSMA
jgi:hypothetical protein